MEKIVVQTLLYDFYGELLTPHQKKIYGDMVLNDMSLSEIAEEQGISRQGVHDIIKRSNKLLSGYEDKLKLIEKFQQTKEMVVRIQGYVDQIMDQNPRTEIAQNIDHIKHISNAILEEL